MRGDRASSRAAAGPAGPEPASQEPASQESASQESASQESAGEVIALDCWSEPLTSRQLSSAPQAHCGEVWNSEPAGPSPQPSRSGCGLVIADWVTAAIMAEPSVQLWLARNGRALMAATSRADANAQSELVAAAVQALYAAEGGAAMVDELVEEWAAEVRRSREQQPPPAAIVRRLPDGSALRVALSENAPRRPTAMLCYPTAEGTACLTVLRDARLGGLADIADTMADRYLVPAAEVVRCLLTGATPRIHPVRMGVRFRQFQVQGVPVTASSRIALEVDPQIEPADLARTFAHWQRANKVIPCHTDPKLAAFAGKLIGRLWSKPARRLQRSSAGGDPLMPALTSTRRAWTSMAVEANTDPRLVTRRTAAVVRILMPFDADHVSRWLWLARHR